MCVGGEERGMAAQEIARAKKLQGRTSAIWD